jgi:hypothetical protein
MAIQQNLTCPMPTNLNPLSPNGFQFSITKLPEVSYFCQEVNLPDITIGVAEQATPFSDAKIPGDKLQYGELQLQFLIDEDMANYVAIYNWLSALGFPKDKSQYVTWLEEHDMMNSSELQKGYSDGVLAILNNSNAPSKAVRFIDMFPTSLNSITFQSTSTDVAYLIGNATFAYSYYEFE